MAYDGGMTEPTTEPGDHGSLQGWVPDVAEPGVLFDALAKALDYRGDVTVTTHDGREITGYIFDRQAGQGLDDSYIRLLPAGSNDKQTVVYADIARLRFTGKDTAHGKTWENWLKRYAEKKRKGESADLYGDE